MNTKSAAVLMMFFLLAAGVHAQLYVNEVMSGNSVTLPDEDGTYSDWFEIYNSGPGAENLDGYYSTDTPSLPTQWRFPSVTMPANSFLLVWASGKNKTNPLAPLHTNFKISAGGEPIQLIAPDGVTIVDSIPAIAIATDKTYGRLTDGGTLGFLAAPTPNATNVIAVPPLAMSFSKEAGIVNGSFNLTITTNRNATIYYTLDGSTPTASSQVYAGPLTITNNSGKPNVLSMINTTSAKWTPPIGEVEKATVVRAVAIAGNETTPIKTATYIVDGSFTVMVISITANASQFFDYVNGIYVKGKLWDDAEAAGWQGTSTFHPANYRTDNETLVHVEMFETNGTRVVDQDTGLQISGQGSRARQQKSMRFYARSEYGKSSISYRIFPDQSLTSYKRLTVRNADDDNRTTFIRDVLAAKMVQGTPLASEDYRPSVVFLNGEYWGFYPLREKGNQHYVESHYGINKDNVIILEDNALLSEGLPGEEQPYLDLVDFVNTHDMNVPENYAYAQARMDTSDFARYYALETYVGNTDWPSRNVVIWRMRTNNTNATSYSDGRWRWILHDADYAFGYMPSQGADYDMFNHVDAQTTWGGALWRGLARNEQFRDKFVTISADQLRANFTPSNLIAIIDSLAAGIAPEVPQQILRWTTLSSVTQWQLNLESLRQYVRDRPAYYRSQLANYFGLGGTVDLTVTGDDSRGTVQINALNVTTASTGTYFQDVPVTLTAYPKAGKVFLGWTGAASGASPTIQLVMSQNTAVGAVFADAPASVPSGASIWATRKYPATHVTLTEQQNMTLLLELANPQSVPVSVTWTVDGVPVNGNSLLFNYVGSTIGNHTVEATVSAADVTLHQRWIVTVKKTFGQICFTHLADIPATCEGGSITQDTTSGCRTIVCDAPGKSLRVLACEKPTATNPAWFEMYRQNSADGLKICLGATCIGGNGFAQTNYPVCVAIPNTISFTSTYPANATVTLLRTHEQEFSYTISNPANLPTGSRWYLNGTEQLEQEDLSSYLFVAQAVGSYNLTVNVSSTETSIFRSWIVNVVEPTNTTGNGTGNQTNTTVCVSHVSDVPASCVGGDITVDTPGGCRALTCVGGTGSVQVLACDKPGSYNAQYFEMYRQGGTGSGVSLCLGTTCISNNGYAKSSNYPVCVTVTNGTGNQTNTTGNQTNSTQNISIATRTPLAYDLLITLPAAQTLSFTLNNPSGITTSTQWFLNAVPVTGTSSYVLSQPAGVYNVTARVSSSQNNVSTEWMVTVQNAPVANASATLSIAPWFPQGSSYVFICTASGFTPTSYDWVFGDGQKQLGSSRNDVYHTYLSSGSYTVMCTANGATPASSTLNIVV